MNLLRRSYLLILSVVLIFTALIILGYYGKNETVESNELGESAAKEIGNTQGIPLHPAQCDIVADTFYLSFHSNMDSLAFYNELKNNPSTENGFVEISHGLALSIEPKFNKEGCLDYVVLQHRDVDVLARSVELSDKPNEFDQEEQKFRDIIIKELKKVYGPSKIRRVNDKDEHSYSDKKIRFVIKELHLMDGRRLDASALGCNGDETFSNPVVYHGYVYDLYFYSNRYINECDRLRTEEEQERKRLQHNEDSIDRTAGQRLQ
jgi:hypothetical protein